MGDARMYQVENMASKINQVFGERLATARKLRGLSQTTLAERTGYSRATIANLELGKQNVQLHQIFSLSKALNADLNELIPEKQAIYSGYGSQAEVFIQLAKSRLNLLMGNH